MPFFWFESYAHHTTAIPRYARGILSKQGEHEITYREESDWNLHDEFFQFTRGCFVIDEKEQLSKRHVRFNMDELAQEAAKAVDAKYCIKVEKCADGMFNKAYIFTHDNDKQVIGKVPNPNAGIPHYTTASEVATLDFVRYANPFFSHSCHCYLFFFFFFLLPWHSITNFH